MSWFRQFLVGNVMKAGNPQDGLFQKADGTVWLRNPDGSETQVGAGGGSVTTREQINGNNVTIANGASGALTFDTKASGSDLLDLSTPAAPTVVVGGNYAVTVQTGPVGSMTAGGSYRLVLELDQAGEDASVGVDAAPAVAANLGPIAFLSLTYYLPAGAVIAVTVYNNDGVLDLDFALGAVIQRLN